MKTFVVVGLGPVGLTLAVAAGQNHPHTKIVGLDIDQTLVDLINSNQCPLATKDNKFHSLLTSAILEKKFEATTNSACLKHADVVVVAVGPVVQKDKIDNTSFLQAIETIAQQTPANTLVIITATLAIGMMQTILPQLSHLQVAYAFERITPGGNMLNSTSEKTKIIAAKNDSSFEAAKAFFNCTESVLVSFAEAEMTKLLENSYRATNIALIHEWTLLAEKMGVNLFSVIASIRTRSGTHDNIRTPGAGIGGPCLLKDSMLSVLSRHEIDMPFLKLAIGTSDKMNQHIAELAAKATSLGVLGLSYRPEVNDLRNSPALNVISKVATDVIFAYDELVTSVEEYPRIEIINSLEALLEKIDVLVIFHPLNDEMTSVLLSQKRKLKIVDTSDFVSDDLAHSLNLNGIQLSGVGKGHWRTMGYDQ